MEVGAGEDDGVVGVPVAVLDGSPFGRHGCVFVCNVKWEGNELGRSQYEVSLSLSLQCYCEDQETEREREERRRRRK